MKESLGLARRILRVLAVGALMLVEGERMPAVAQEDQLGNDATRIFAEAMAADPGNTPIQKWAKDIRFSIIGNGEADPKLVGLAGATFSEIERLTGVKARYSTEKSNFIIIFVKDVNAEAEKYKSIFRYAFSNDASGEAALNDFLSRVKSNHEPFTAIQAATKQSEIYIYCLVLATQPSPSGKDASPETYLVRGLLTGMGLGSGTVSQTSVLNVAQDRASLSNADKLVLKAFYSKLVQPGMTIDEARRVFEGEVKKNAAR